MSEWPSTYVPILGCSKPPCAAITTDDDADDADNNDEADNNDDE